MRIILGFLAVLMGVGFVRAAEPTTKPATKPALPFEAEILAFEAADRKQMPPRDAVLFIGSSSIRMWKTLAQDFPDRKVINRGFGGSQISDSIRYADRIIVPYHPSRIVFYAGDNDLAGGKTPQRVADDFKTLVQGVRKDLPGVRFDFIAIKPSIARVKIFDKVKEANALIEAYTKSADNLGFIDVVPLMLDADGKPRAELFIQDGLHMNEKGYAIWTKIVGERLK